MTVLSSANDLASALTIRLLEILSRSAITPATLNRLVLAFEALVAARVLIVADGLNIYVHEGLPASATTGWAEVVAQLQEDDAATWLKNQWPAYAEIHVLPLQVRGQRIGSVGLFVEENATEAMPLLQTSLIYALQVVMEQLVASARSEQLLRNQYEFVRVVTHDLRSPLTAMHGFATMLDEEIVGTLNEKQHHYIAKVVSGTTQLAALIENIADAGRYDPETGFYEMTRSLVDPNEIVRSVTRNYLVPAEKSELTLHMVTSDQVPVLNVDHNMIERAVTNLVDNAIKYTPNGGRITVGVRVEGERLVIYVSDTGLGISPENMKKLFQRHVRLRLPEHKLIKGVGLGLFIVRSVALRHGGEAFVESEAGKGSTFGIWLPLHGENALAGDLPTVAE